MIDRSHLTDLLVRERATFKERNPRSFATYTGARHLFGRVPMTWMNKAAGGFPLYAAKASGARVEGIVGHRRRDFCLGDTVAVQGYPPTTRAKAVGGAAAPADSRGKRGYVVYGGH